MVFNFPRLLLKILLFSFPPVVVSRADPGWVRLFLTGPNVMEDLDSVGPYRVDNVLVGTPPATRSPLLNIASPVLAISSDDCVFCPGTDLFRPSLSSTFYNTNKTWPSSGNVQFNGVKAQDTVSFGGVLTSGEVPFNLVQKMSLNFTSRLLADHLGLYVNDSTEISRNEHILSRLHSSGQLLNPVVGLRLGNTPETSHVTIGALDSNDFDGTINWVQAEPPDPRWDIPVAIKIDGFRGFNGSLLPFQDLLAHLSTINPSLSLPNSWTYISQEGYSGSTDAIGIDTEVGLYGYMCNEAKPYVHMSVDINGINYQLDSEGLTLSKNGFCHVLVANLTTDPSVSSSLGLPFMRSVYVAYRFPTEDCPNAYYGFAFPKGANRTSSMISQQPRSTPTASVRCLSFATPSSTPTVLTPVPQISSDQFMSVETYEVLGESGQQVRLRGVDELAPRLVRGVEIKED